MIRVRMRDWNSRIFLILPAAFFLVLQNASSLCAQPAMYGTGQWDRHELANHRVLIAVKDDVPAVWAHIPWSRQDDPRSKSVILVDTSSSKKIRNFRFLRVSREFADMEFEPSTGQGRYLV